MEATVADTRSARSGALSRFVLGALRMLLSWAATGLVTGMMIFGLSFGAIAGFGADSARLPMYVIVALGTVLISHYALKGYMRKMDGREPGFMGMWTDSLMPPFKNGEIANPILRFLAWLGYWPLAFYSGAIIGQGVYYKLSHRRPTLYRTAIGASLFGVKLGWFWYAIAAGVHDPGDFMGAFASGLKFW